MTLNGEHPLWKNFSWTFAGMLIYTLCQWGTLSALSKIGTPQAVGQFALGLAVTAPIILFSNLQLRIVQATDSREDYAFGDYLGLRITTILLSLTLISAIAWLSEYRLEIALIILTVGVAKAFESLSDVYYGLLQRHERMDVVAISMMIKGPLSLFALGLTFYLTGSLLWATAALALSWGLVAIGYDIRSGALLAGEQSRWGIGLPKPRWNIHILYRLAWLTLPLGFVAALNSLVLNIPLYVSSQYLSERELGIFAALAYIMASVRLVSGALANSASPRLARFYAEGDRMAFGSLLLKLVLLGLSVGIAGILASLFAGRWILILLYTPEYAAYTGLLTWVMIATGINYVTSVLTFGIMSARRFRVQALTLVGVVVTTGVACLIFIPWLGVVGGGVALALGMTFQLVANSLIILHAVGNTREPAELGSN